MIMWILRGMFLSVCAGVGWAVAGWLCGEDGKFQWGLDHTSWILICLGAGLLLIVCEAVITRVPVAVISSVVFGLLAGFILSRLLFTVVEAQLDEKFHSSVKLALACVCCYFCIALIYRTRDRFNFIIPYAEFHREQRGPRPLILDTSAIIDGRIADLAETGVVDSRLVVPKFVLQELHGIADSPDKHKRSRGRRGLDVLNRLRQNRAIDIQIHDGQVPGVDNVDDKLVRLARILQGKLATTDFNLNKVAAVEDIPVINVNEVAGAVRPLVLPGEELSVELIRAGEAHGQAVGFLDDGTMVVAENARDRIGRKVTISVTRVLQQSSGRMIFGKPVTA